MAQEMARLTEVQRELCDRLDAIYDTLASRVERNERAIEGIGRRDS